MLIPLYTAQLTTAEFGLYALIEISLTITLSISLLGLDSAYLKWFADVADPHRGELLASCLAMGLLVSLAAGTVYGAFVLSPWSRSLFQAQVGRYALPLVGVIITETEQSLLLTDLRARRRPAAYSLTTAFRLVALVGATLWFVLSGMGIMGILLGRLAGNVVALLALFAMCLPGRHLQITRRFMLPMGRFGFPLVWASLAGLSMDAVGRFFVGKFASLDQVAYYALAVKISNFMQVGFLAPFGAAWSGFVYQIYHRPQAQLTYAKLLGYAFLIAALMASCLTLFAPTLVMIFGRQAYAPAVGILPWVLLPQALRVIEYWACLGIYLKNRTAWMPWIAALGVVVVLLINVALTPSYGVYGAVTGWILSLIAMIVATVVVSHRYYPVPFFWGALTLATLFFAVAIPISRALPVTLSWTAVLPSGVGSLVLATAVALYVYRDLAVAKTRVPTQDTMPL